MEPNPRGGGRLGAFPGLLQDFVFYHVSEGNIKADLQRKTKNMVSVNSSP